MKEGRKAVGTASYFVQCAVSDGSDLVDHPDAFVIIGD